MQTALALPNGRVFAVLIYHSIGAQVGTLETVYTTRSASAMSAVRSAIATATAPLPKLRPPTKGSKRSVSVVEIRDASAVQAALETGALPKRLTLGQIFPSLQEAGTALGLGPHSIRTIFARERRKNRGQEAPVFVRGYLLNFVEPRVGRDHLRDDRRKPGPTFIDHSLAGRRLDPAEVRELNNALRRRAGKEEDTRPTHKA